MSTEQKALRACGDYARLNSEIRQLTREIGDCLMRCKGVEVPCDVQDGPNLIIGGASTTETHLKRLYRGVIDDDDYYPTIRYLSDKEIHARLFDECPHCLGAHHAILMRKAARRSLGGAKRFITLLGRAAPKELA
jgi:hypothetical protein